MKTTFIIQLYKDQKFQNKSKYRQLNTMQYNNCVFIDIPCVCYYYYLSARINIMNASTQRRNFEHQLLLITE